jgi:hypothetical protein
MLETKKSKFNIFEIQKENDIDMSDVTFTIRKIIFVVILFFFSDLEFFGRLFNFFLFFYLYGYIDGTLWLLIDTTWLSQWYSIINFDFMHSQILSNTFQKTLFYHFPHRSVISSLRIDMTLLISTLCKPKC